MKRMLAVAVAAVLGGVSAPGFAAESPDDIAQIREQLQGLMQRVDRLEQENNTLKTENENLKAQDEYLKAETRGLRKESAMHANEVNKVKGADWAGRVAVKGDLRYRYEMIDDATSAAPSATTPAGTQAVDVRYRDRIRARVNVEAKATDDILVGVGFATTENGDPRSSNQSLDGVFTRKAIDLDLAYFDWKFASWGNLIGGKMKQPFVKPSQSLFWDNDVNPEGLALTFNRGIWFGTGYSYWIDEISGRENQQTSDVMLYGGQIGARLPVGGSTLTLSAHYYDLASGQLRAPGPFYSNSANNNTTVNFGTPTAPSLALLYDYEVANVSAEFATTLGSLPLVLFAEAAENQDPDDLNTAWAAGFRLGAASNYRTWEFGAMYQSLEKDALFAQLVDSDFGAGLTDTEGFVVRAGYAPVRNWIINATYFINKLNVDVANAVGETEVDYDRLQVDFNVKF
jgi:cell division protein FtsB